MGKTKRREDKTGEGKSKWPTTLSWVEGDEMLRVTEVSA